MLGNSPFLKVQLVHIFDGVHSHAVQWELDPGFKDEGPFMFTVEVSETPDFSQLAYTLPPTNSYIAYDNTNVLQTNTPSWYYRVKLVTGSGAIHYSYHIHHYVKKEDAYKYWYASDIVRREFVRFKYTGHDGWIIKRKNFGEIAKGYVDPISGVPISDSSVDVSTGITGGYHKPLKIKYSEEAGVLRTSMSEDGMGVNQIEQLKVRMVGYPIVVPKDILVSDINARYVIGEDVAHTYFPGTYIIVVQTFTARLLPFNDVVYTVPVE